MVLLSIYLSIHIYHIRFYYNVILVWNVLKSMEKIIKKKSHSNYKIGSNLTLLERCLYKIYFTLSKKSSKGHIEHDALLDFMDTFM